MSGIFGAITREANVKNKLYDCNLKSHCSILTEEYLKKLNKIQTDCKIVLGLDLLTPQNLSNDSKPWAGRDDFVLIFDGEIYNHMELRKVASEYNYTTNSSTETLIALYEKFGVSFVEFLEGMFVICVADIREGRIYLLCDHVGIKPLYMLQSNGTICFSSNIESIIKFIGYSPCVNLSYFQRNMYLDPFVGYSNMTPFCGITRLEAGTIYSIDLYNMKVETSKYYDM